MKVLTVSDSPNICSGLARVHRHVIDAAVEAGHEVVACGWFAYDAKTSAEVKAKKIPPPRVFYKDTRVLDTPKSGDNSAMFALFNTIKLFKPDVVVTIGDYWDFWYMQAIKLKTDYAFKWVAYLTIEHDDIDEQFVSLLKFADALVVPSEYGKGVLEEKCKLPVECIPYGTEEAFHLYDSEKRNQLREKRNCKGKLRFITVGQNTIRKNIPAIIQAIELLDHRDPDKLMQFYIHTNVNASDPQEVYVFDLIKIAEKLGVADRVFFPEDKPVSVFAAPADEFLADEYNASDFFISASACEGFGLPMLEAMACGLPVIANATSTVHEMVGAKRGANFGWAPRGYLVSNKIEVHPPAKMVHVVRPEALAQAIWDAFLMWDEKAKDLEGIRQKCVEYGKGRTWAAMKQRIAAVIERAKGPARIPVEILG